jgi:D-alanyl-D-alanine carboxypeptidase (penicillin-binding protein 5/6)
LEAPISRGEKIGTIVYSLGGVTLEEIPLVADRTVQKGMFVIRAADRLIKKLLPAA